jgi:hypothetical protein
MLADALAVCCSGANPSAHSQSCAHDERWFHSLRQTGGDHDSAPICTRSHTVLLQKTSEVRTGEARGDKILPPWAHRQDGVKACRQSTFQWCCTQNWRGLDEGSAPRDVGLGLASPCRRALRPAGAYATATYTIDGCKKACLRPAKSLHAIGTAVFSGAPWTLAHGKIPVSFGLQTEELSTVGSKLDQVLARLPPPSATPAIGAGYGHDGNGAGNGGASGTIATGSSVPVSPPPRAVSPQLKLQAQQTASLPAAAGVRGALPLPVSREQNSGPGIARPKPSAAAR